jgi:hypothetical protein
MNRLNMVVVCLAGLEAQFISLNIRMLMRQQLNEPIWTEKEPNED